MKIAIYVPSWPPGKTASGIVTYASQLIPALRDMGHEVFVITPGKNDDDPHTVDLNAFWPSPSVVARAAEYLVPGTLAWRAMAHAVRSAVCHLVQTRNVELFEIEETFGVNSAISRSQVIPIVVRLHGPWFLTGAPRNGTDETRYSKRRQRLEGIGLKNATLVSAPTNEILRRVRSRYKFVVSNARVIPNSIRTVDEPTKWRLETCDPNNILFVGRFDRAKGGDLVLRVYAELAAIYPKLSLTFVGPDLGILDQDGKLLDFDTFVCSTLPSSCRSRITFLGQIPHPELISLRKRSYLTLVASEYETMPYSVLEAMSMGSPIVATQVGGIPEMIRDGRSGLLVAPGDPGHMAEACKRLIENPNLAASLGNQSWTDCCKFYSPAMVAEQTVEGYSAAKSAFKSRG